VDHTAIRFVRWSWIAGILLLEPAQVNAQAPEEPPSPVCNRRGWLHRKFHHVEHTLQDKMIGYPENFVEPPLGYYVNEQLAVQVAKADTHRFTLYHTDFLPGTNQFSPSGASRFNIMATRFPGWLGPITIEWTPDQPELAQSRRQAIVEVLRQQGKPILADRVVIAPSPYPGAMGVEAAHNFGNTIVRSEMSAPAFALPPTESSAQGVR
jgi:hypothetical protein